MFEISTDNSFKFDTHVYKLCIDPGSVKSQVQNMLYLAGLFIKFLAFHNVENLKKRYNVNIRRVIGSPLIKFKLQPKLDFKAYFLFRIFE